MKTYTKFFLSIFLLATLSGCNNEKGDEKKCSGADNCGESTPSGKGNTKEVVTFLPSHFFDQKQNRWRTISTEELQLGGVGANLPIFSDFLNIPISEAMSYVTLASSQVVEPNAYAKSMHNRIPYIKIPISDGATYIYNFQKLNLAGVEVAGKTGSFIVDGDNAYLPFINEMFGGLFFPAEITEPSSNFTYKLRIVAQSTSKKQSDVHTISFDATLVVPSKDFSLVYSDAMRDITLENRWHHLYNGADGIPNVDLELATMHDSSGVAESIPLDIKVIFKTQAPIIIDKP